MKLRINEKETPNRTKYHRRKCNLLSDEEYNYWYDIGLEAFNKGDKCIPIHSKELIAYMTKNPAKIGSIESKKSNQMSIAWSDGWNFGNLHNDEFKFESLKEAETPNKDILMKYKTYGNIEKCFNILVNEKGYSKEEAQDIIDNVLADYKYNSNSTDSLLRRINLVLPKDEYEKEFGINESKDMTNNSSRVKSSCAKMCKIYKSVLEELS